MNLPNGMEWNETEDGDSVLFKQGENVLSFWAAGGTLEIFSREEDEVLTLKTQSREHRDVIVRAIVAPETLEVKE